MASRDRAELPEALRPLADLWIELVRTPRRRALVAGVSLVIALSLLVARRGTLNARAGAAAIVVATIAAIVWTAWRERNVWRDSGRTIARVAGRIEPERAARALRALTLLETAVAEGDRDVGSSMDLVRLHVARSLAALPRDRIGSGASRLAFAFGAAALALAAATLGVVATNPWGILEGANVLAARNGVAPLPMAWLDDLEMRARPPDYLHQDERHPSAYDEVSLPRGSLLTFRGVLIHMGRRLALTDGRNEVPFVDDGAGHVIARWPLEGTVTLRIVARFGDVLVDEPEATHVKSIDDDAPKVTLEGAPKRIVLAESEAGGEIPIRYTASDDHGLREVHLVLRSGAREERRVLAKLDGETRFDRGGHVLRSSDPFIKKSHAAVEVRVEAKDNDVVTGPKWGGSGILTLLPPDVGEPEARRMEALRKLRDAFVDSLAKRMADGARVSDLLKGIEDDGDLLDATLSSAYAGSRIAGRLQAILRGQMRSVKDAATVLAHVSNPTARAGLTKASERLVLVLDGMIRGLAQKDARDAARQLADVADDLATAAMQTTRGDQVDRAVARMEAAELVLHGGEKSLARLGALGMELSEMIEAALLRVERARTEDDMPHAELAARDLAARLHTPDPSFGGGGKSTHAGGESGGGRGTPGDASESGDEGGEAEHAFNEAAEELEQLAQDHAKGIGDVEHALNAAQSEDDVKAMSEEAKNHARSVRDATKGLPSIGAGSDSWTSKGAAARESAEQMARSLEEGRPADAVGSGKTALQALEDAKKSAKRERWFGEPDDTDADKRLDEAKKKLEPEVRWAEKMLDDLREKAADRARGDLSRNGDEEEKRADRAREIAEKGRGQAGLPEQMLESLEGAERSAREASQSLKRGDADRGLQQQREAQRQLEAAEHEGKDDHDEDDGHGNNGDQMSKERTDIPTADAHKAPEDFRKRVIKGLGESAGGRQKDAVRRYAEGLLR